MGPLTAGHFGFGLLIGLVVFIIPAWRITAKAGFPGALSLLLLIPLLNIVLIWIFAFSRWPIEKSGT
jgi:hypothetical protein